MKHKKIKPINIAIILCLFAFVFSAFMVARHFVANYIHQNDFNKLSQNAPKPTSPDTESEPEPQALTPAEFYNSLYQQNPHTQSYLIIPDTNVSYPVMSTPTSPEYYLRRDFNKNYSYYGTPFVEQQCKLDGNAKIIYGHHIRGEKMFGELLNYKNTEYLNSHSLIYLYTAQGEQVYTVIGAAYTDSLDSNLLYTRAINGFYTEGDYNLYISDVKKLCCSINNSFNPNPLSEILLLSTCEYSKKDGRFIVFAAKSN